MNHMHAKSVDSAVFDRAVIITSQPWAAELEQALTERVGRQRTHRPTTLLTLLAVTALESGGTILLTGAVSAATRLSVTQRHQIDLTGPVYVQQLSRLLGDIESALKPRINLRTGEIREPRYPHPLEMLCTQIIISVIPNRLPATTTQAIDSTDIESYSARRSWSSDGKPDVAPGGLPEKAADEKKRRSPATPGWPKLGMDGRHQHTIDPEVREGYRSGKGRAPKGIFLGFDAHISVDVADRGAEHRASLIRGLVLAPAGSSKADAGIRLIDAIKAAGAPVDCVINDRGYSYGKVEKWAGPLADRGVEQVIDLHATQRGVRPGPTAATIFIDGSLYSGAIPKILRTLQVPTLDSTKEEKVEITKLHDARAAYAFRPMGGPNLSARTQRYRGPAEVGTIRCPNHRKPDRKNLAKIPTTNCAPGCDCGRTITLGPDDGFQTRQRAIYGTRKWKESYGRRVAVESANALFKRHHVTIARGSLQVRGLVSYAILLSLTLAGVNASLLEVTYGYDIANPSAENCTLVARPLRTRALHRKKRDFTRPKRRTDNPAPNSSSPVSPTAWRKVSRETDA